MALLVLVLHFAGLFSLAHLTALIVAGSDHWLAAEGVFSPNDRELQIVSLVHVNIFGSFSNRRGGESFLVPTLRCQKMKGKRWNLLTFR